MITFIGVRNWGSMSILIQSEIIHIIFPESMGDPFLLSIFQGGDKKKKPGSQLAWEGYGIIMGINYE